MNKRMVGYYLRRDKRNLRTPLRKEQTVELRVPEGTGDRRLVTKRSVGGVLETATVDVSSKSGTVTVSIK
jgi:hypothetical protein